VYESSCGCSRGCYDGAPLVPVLRLGVSVRAPVPDDEPVVTILGTLQRFVRGHITEPTPTDFGCKHWCEGRGPHGSCLAPFCALWSRQEIRGKKLVFRWSGARWLPVNRSQT
jgi:hypothetical protein